MWTEIVALSYMTRDYAKCVLSVCRAVLICNIIGLHAAAKVENFWGFEPSLVYKATTIHSVTLHELTGHRSKLFSGDRQHFVNVVAPPQYRGFNQTLYKWSGHENDSEGHGFTGQSDRKYFQKFILAHDAIAI